MDDPDESHPGLVTRSLEILGHLLRQRYVTGTVALDDVTATFPHCNEVVVFVEDVPCVHPHILRVAGGLDQPRGSG
jgi:hypothetical protein